jgi:hypothetical protein
MIPIFAVAISAEIIAAIIAALSAVGGLATWVIGRQEHYTAQLLSEIEEMVIVKQQIKNIEDKLFNHTQDHQVNMTELQAQLMEIKATVNKNDGKLETLLQLIHSKNHD